MVWKVPWRGCRFVNGCGGGYAPGCSPPGAYLWAPVPGCVWLMSEEWGLSRWLPLARG